MTRRHDPQPPGQPEPGELPVEPDQGTLPATPPLQEGGDDGDTVTPPPR